MANLAMRERKSHIFKRDEADHYVEPLWVSARLFETETFDGNFILDPACGWGRILVSAQEAGYKTKGSDIAMREPSMRQFRKLDFLAADAKWWVGGSIVCNPPFNLIREFYERAIELVHPGCKVAMIWPARRLAAATWLRETPLQKILYLNPRPSMPTGEFIIKCGRVGNGTQDFCWLIWRKGGHYRASASWLTRD